MCLALDFAFSEWAPVATSSVNGLDEVVMDAYLVMVLVGSVGAADVVAHSECSGCSVRRVTMVVAALANDVVPYFVHAIAAADAFVADAFRRILSLHAHDGLYLNSARKEEETVFE